MSNLLQQATCTIFMNLGTASPDVVVLVRYRPKEVNLQSLQATIAATTLSARNRFNELDVLATLGMGLIRVFSTP